MKKILIIYIVCALCTLTACKKAFLDRQPLDSYSASSGDPNALLAGVYAGQSDPNFEWCAPAWSSGSAVVYWDCMSDNAYSAYYWERIQGYGNGTITPSSNYFINNWNYTTINKCNFFLTNIGNLEKDTATLHNMVAQVKFIRAYQYFIMTQLYGDVPLVTTQLTPEQADESVRTPKAEVIQFILNELKAAIPDLSPESKYKGTPDEGHITIGAATALKMRVELYNQDYKDCIADCQSLMSMGYSLDPDYTDLFKTTNQYNNPEIISAIQYSASSSSNTNGVLAVMPSNSMGGQASICPLQSLVDAYEMTNGKVITDPASGYDPLHPYTNRDPRLAMTILYPGEAFTYADGTKSFYDPLDQTSQDYYLPPLSNRSASGYIVKKFTSNLADYNTYGLYQTGLNMIIFRYAEVLLSYAEAKVESNQIDGTVYTALNLIRNRVGMPNVDQSIYSSQTSLRSLVRRERRVELAMEGLRYYDIQRWKIGPQTLNGQTYGARMGTVNPNTGAYTITGDSLKVENRIFADKNYLWPVPQNEINLDKNLKQNPGF
ncbi:RagB/SusD family nutrient uptake outer membrane protein [Mucilaginibacter sp. X5P1]|uniref:RagB/SusD family nutrient uptake outer membrane protein n=1 Tax=Mucilaginibacter sp. X5P1 TaxID=2723088 RepID=UPI0016176ABA|nr:RagB/SusD family nutrient uptake outer membrane protein [Mucilaginibacter sp. X5P1]MBB6141791.1 hypothetical protein [Mucilaginibacter sp. X5P1]